MASGDNTATGPDYSYTMEGGCQFGGTSDAWMQYFNTTRRLQINGQEVDYNSIITAVLSYHEAPLDQIIHDCVECYDHRLVNEQMICYRGCPQDVRCDKIGPNPHRTPQRYNRQGQRCLYLADSPEGVCRETAAIILQNYNVPVGKLRIADMVRDDIHDSALNLLFWITEHGVLLDGRKLSDVLRNVDPARTGYYLSHKLADAFREFGWDGVFVPGVKGDRTFKYSNLNVFEPACEFWKGWTVGTKYEARNLGN